MRLDRNTLISFLLLILIASLYRAMPGRPWGFAPQLAMAIFGGAMLKDKKLAFLLPVLSMFISDLLYQVLYVNGIGEIPGFYSGQLTNYILFAAMTIIGFFVNPLRPAHIGVSSLAAPLIYFLASNTIVWAGGGGLQRPKTFQGLLMCYSDGLPFLQGSMLGTLFFSTVLFGGAFLVNKYLRSQHAH